MTTYSNLSGKSGILSYEIGDDFIIVEFKSEPNRERFYKYTYSSAGSVNIEKMKILAKKGLGLNSFIMLNVKNNYESKW